MPHICATKFFSLIANRLFSITLPERASGLIPAFEVKVFETLPVYLQEKVNRLLKDCFHTTTRTPEEQAEHEDRYCSNEDIIGHVVALHDDKVFGVIIVLKRNI